MLPLLFAASLALAQPGRTTGGLDAGLDLSGRPVLRAGLDYGLRHRISITAELGARLAGAEGARLAGGLGPRLDLVDGRWWRLGLIAQPELGLRVDGPSGAALDPALQGRLGLRLGWLAFWGLSLTLRVDGVQRLGWDAGQGRVSLAAPRWLEGGLGLAVRL